MAPRETPKKCTKMSRTIKEIGTKIKGSPTGAIKKTILNKKTVEKTPLKG